MRIIASFLILLLPLLALSSCRMFSDANKPFLAFTDIDIPEGTPKFQQGFKDGCGSALYARGNVYYRTKYGYKFDPAMIDDSEYGFGHRRGYSYCFTYMSGSGHMAGGADMYVVPTAPFNMTAGNLNNSWNYGNLDWGIGADYGGLNAPFTMMSGSGKAGGGGGVMNSHPLWGTPYSGYIFGH